MRLLFARMTAAGTMRIAGVPMGASVRLMGVLVSVKFYPISHGRELAGNRE
jgi:hypothetical protein